MNHEVAALLHVLVVPRHLVKEADALGSETPAGRWEKVLDAIRKTWVVNIQAYYAVVRAKALAHRHAICGGLLKMVVVGSPCGEIGL
jgi:hypothetical protein